ncbi:MAG: RNA methyltransferase [Candidatus Pseudobacter hemicellulosilyticus]|uniref:RNA methyltransferase n=1 Tax=Candidatus Pseudobacter hemicellulosilyticus TaxID=3121375 RepID=A0AAJ5WRG2_9BACT|nr:MAG: RNA methyltransferase [Pseudobacter sp.]
MAIELPADLLQSLQGIRGFNQPAFEQVHASGGQITSIRVNPARQSATAGEWQPGGFDPAALTPVPWSRYGFYLPERPSFTFDPLFHAGTYYVQEASSMFLEQALLQTTDTSKKLRVLDLCAAPGGKSTHLQSLLSPDSLLVSNEVIRTRAAILEENLVKWGAANVIVTNNDPQDFARIPGFFDVLVIDAPCSGSGLFRREPEAIREWSPQAVQLCCQRQQRILAESFTALADEGLLIYSTCSYSVEEDEDILDWLMDTFQLETVPLQTEPDWGIVPVQSALHQAAGYRFFPDKIKGEGFFLACFRKKEGDRYASRSPKKAPLVKAGKAEAAVVQPWLRQAGDWQFWKQQELILAFPTNLEQELLTIADKFYIRSAGITLGKIAGKDLVPEHALALSGLLAPEIVAVSLKKAEALQYLRKEPLELAATTKGWALVQYAGFSLGWVKLLPNRVNNYYPSAWRILKSGNN